MSGAAQSITVRPVLWRSLVFPLLSGLAGALMVSLVLLVFAGDWPHGFWSIVAGGAHRPRDRPPHRLAQPATRASTRRCAAPLAGPARPASPSTRSTGGSSLGLASPPGSSASAWRARDGSRKVIIDRWQYRPDEMRRLLAGSHRLAGERVRGTYKSIS